MSIRSTDIRNNEQGGIIILTTLLLAVFFGLAALAIDLTFFSASLEQERHNAKVAALAALQAYLNSDSDNEAERVHAALARANSVSDLNTVLARGDAGANELALGDEAGIQLIPGKWYYDLDYETNPCVDGEEPPCFVASDFSSGDTSNSFRIRGNLHQQSSNLIGKSLGFAEEFENEIDVVVGSNVRYGCFGVDLSASLMRTTHPKLGIISDPSDPLFGSNVENKFAFSTTNLADIHNYTNTLAPTRGSSTTDPKIHFQDDYQTVSTFTDADFDPSEHEGKHLDPSDFPGYSMTPIQGTYRIDAFRDGTYTGPEPLNTVFTGIRAAAELFKERAVAGDKMCVIFYDSQLSWSRVITLTDDFDYIIKLTDTTPYDDNGDGALDTDKGLGLLIKHGLFPTPGSRTNSLMAINEALRQFREANNGSSNFWTSNFIMMIGDGLSNCSACPAALDPDLHDITSYAETSKDGINVQDLNYLRECLKDGEAYYSSYQSNNGLNICDMLPNFDFDGDGLTTSADAQLFSDIIYDYEHGICRVLGCANDYMHYRESVLAVQRFALQVANKKLNIPIHVSLVGENVAPHTRDHFDPSGTDCLTDSQARNQELSWVRGGYGNGWYTSHSPGYEDEQSTRFNNMSPSEPYYNANYDWYKVATMTGGIWAPIRPPAADSEPDCNPDGTIPGERRRLTDAQQRTPHEQMQAYMAKIMEENPFVILDIK